MKAAEGTTDRMLGPQEYRQRYRELQDWYRAHFAEKRIRSSGGGTLRVALPSAPSAKVSAIVVSGRTEFIEKYLEFSRDLQARGISTVLYDHCGQGNSDRLLDDRQKGHIDSFLTYVEDLKRVIEALNHLTENTSVSIISHSMGGTVATLLALRHPELISKMVLGSPMCAIRTGTTVPQFLIRPLVAAACRAGYGERYVPTTGPYQTDLKFSDNLFTSDETRFGYNRFLTNSLDFAPLGGPTLRWLHEAYKAMAEMNDGAARLRGPLLTLTAARDQVIKTAVVRTFCTISGNCSYKQYEDARHELFMEGDGVREDIHARIARFLIAEG